MIDELAAGIGLVACVLLLVRLTVGPRRRQRIDALVARIGAGLRLRTHRLWRQARALRLRGRTGAGSPAEAARTAEALIRRLRGQDEAPAAGGRQAPGHRHAKPHPCPHPHPQRDRQAERDGNVIRPRAFQAPPPKRDTDPPPTLH